MKINISYDIECCYDCPHIQTSMDGVTCTHHAWPDKDYGNIIGAIRVGFPSKCPELPENKNPKPVYKCIICGAPYVRGDKHCSQCKVCVGGS